MTNVYDPSEEYCTTSHYTLNHLIDVRLDGHPVTVCATWCSKHDRWISACAYEWFIKAKELTQEGKAAE